MDLEETKKIFENKIEAGELTREVRSQIKTYIDQKQNLREGFKETFEPLIETQEAVKASIDKEQNAMIEQLQKNQKALTEGFEGNRLAITSGFDKMDEVKKWDLSQLPGIEAIEHTEIKEPEEEAEEEYRQEEPGYSISINDMKLLLGGEESDFTQGDEILTSLTKEEFDEILSQEKLNKDKYELKIIDPARGIYKVTKIKYGEEPQKGVATFGDTDLDRGLINKKSDKILKDLKLPLPSKLKNRKLEDILRFQKKAETELDYLGSLLKPNKAILYTKRSE